MKKLSVSLIIISLLINFSICLSNKDNLRNKELNIIENLGQIIDSEGNIRNDIKYYTKINGLSVFFGKNFISYVFAKDIKNTTRNAENIHYRIDLEFLSCNQNLRLIPKSQSISKYNYFLPHCPNGITDVKSYGKIIYKDLYPSIDFVIYEEGNELKFNFIINPGGKINDIKLKYNGDKSTKITNDGKLQVNSSIGKILESKPYSYEIGKKKSDIIQKKIAAKYTINNDIISIEVNNYDEMNALTIDLVSGWRTYCGGSSSDEIRTVTTDSNNDIIVSGVTQSSDFPVTPGAFDERYSNQRDIVVMKFTSSGDLIWSTFVGSNSNDHDFGLCIVENNSIWVGGECYGQGFPTTNDAYQRSFGGGSADAVIFKLSTQGQMLYSTYYGGGEYDVVADIASDSDNNIWITGRTRSTNFPITQDAFQRYKRGGHDAFLVKFDKNGNPLYSTFFGGSVDQFAEGIAVDNKNNVAISGYTYSSDFPISGNVFQSQINGDIDAFLAKFDSSGRIIWSTFFGGGRSDYGSNLTVDRMGNFIITGYTRSSDLPVSQNPFQKENAGGSDAFIAKFDNDGNRVWATYFGGSRDESFASSIIDQGGGVDTDIEGNIIYCGRYTESSNFPVTDDTFQSNMNGSSDAFLVKFDKDGDLLWSTYIGGSSSEKGIDASFDNIGDIIAVGQTSSSDFPVTDGAFQDVYQRQGDGFIIKFGSCPDIDAKITTNGATSFCEGDSVTLRAEPDGAEYNYLWSTGETTLEIIVKKNGEYFVIVESGPGCRDTAYIEIIVSPKPEAKIIADGPLAFCEGDSVTLRAEPDGAGYNYLWSTGETTLEIVVKEGGEYFVIVESGPGCRDTAFIEVIVYPKPEIDIIIERIPTRCKGEIVILKANPFNSEFTYTWSNGEKDSSIIVKESGIYYVIVENQNGCKNKAEVNIEVDSSANIPFDYQNFSLVDNLELVENAQQIDDNVQLTSPSSNVAGAIWFQNKVSIAKGFVTEFKFRMSDPYNNYNDGSIPGADGIAFVIQNFEKDACGIDGGGIGYEGIPNSFAIEFDTYWNLTRNDPNGNHAAVFTNGSSEVSSDHKSSHNLFTNKDILQLIPDGRIYYVKIEYNMEPKALICYIDSTGEYETPVIVIDPIDISKIIELDDSCSAYVGITSATGDSWERHELLGWEICTIPCIITNIQGTDRENISLSSNYPNPFSNKTTIHYSLEIPSKVNLRIYDLLGNELEVLVDEMKAPGNYEVLWNARQYNSGVYLYILRIDNKIEAGRMIINK